MRPLSRVLLPLAILLCSSLASPVYKQGGDASLPTSSDSDRTASSASWQPQSSGQAAPSTSEKTQSSKINQASSSSSELAKSEVKESLYRSRKDIEVEERRREKVKELKSAYQDVKESILWKDPLDVEIDERHRVQELRLQLQAKIDIFNRYREPYLDELLVELKKMRDSLPRRSDYIDKERSTIERRLGNIEAVRRFRTREKVKDHGIFIHVRPTGAPTLNDGAPLLVVKKRVVNRIGRRNQRQRSKQMKHVERENLFAKGWGRKRLRGT